MKNNLKNIKKLFFNIKNQNFDIQIDLHIKINKIFGIYIKFHVLKEFKILKIIKIDEKYHEITKKIKF